MVPEVMSVLGLGSEVIFVTHLISWPLAVPEELVALPGMPHSNVVENYGERENHSQRIWMTFDQRCSVENPTNSC